LGFTVTDLLVNNFGDIVNIDYTAKVEEELDKIASDNQDWVEVVRGFYGPLESDLKKAEATIEKVNLVPEISEETCPKCGKEKMVIKMGRYGKYMECPACAFRQSFRIHTEVPCPDCPEKGELIGRFNKKGKIFYGCSAFPKHKFALNLRPVKEPCPDCGGLMTEFGKGVRCTKCKYRSAKEEPVAGKTG
jgi:DNA topoisomerase-1